MNVKRWEWMGVPVCFGLAVLLHHAYDWSGQAFAVGLFAPVNESVWEHSKLLVIPFLLWQLVVGLAARPPMRTFLPAVAAAAWAMAAAMIAFFYVYSGVLGKNILAVDIVSTLVWLLMGAWIVVRNMRRSGGGSVGMAWAALLLLLAMQVGFSVCPPALALFRDTETGGFGMPAACRTMSIPR